MPMTCVQRFANSTARAVAACAVAATLFGADVVGQGFGLVAQAAGRVQWSVSNRDELRTVFSDAGAVKAFLNDLDNPADGGERGTFAGVKDFRLVDLNNDNRLELVAIVDVSGREFFNNIVIVSQANGDTLPRKRSAVELGMFAMRSVHGFEVADLDSALRDIDGDGVSEILVSDLLEPYRGASTPHATVTEIYRWNGSDYQKASSKYKLYYERVVLPRLERDMRNTDIALEAIPQPAERTSLRLRRDKLIVEVAEVRRRMSQK